MTEIFEFDGPFSVSIGDISIKDETNLHDTLIKAFNPESTIYTIAINSIRMIESTTQKALL